MRCSNLEKHDGIVKPTAEQRARLANHQSAVQQALDAILDDQISFWLAFLVYPALEVLADLLQFGESEQIRLRAARSILDYAGYWPYKPPERITTEMLEKELARVNAEIEELERELEV